MPTFTQNFTTDFDAAIAGLLPGYSGPPYALTRFADGEWAVISGGRHAARSDMWAWKRGDTEKYPALADGLFAALSCDAAGWHVGITAKSHHSEQHDELLPIARLPLDRITFAEIFNFANYRRFFDLDLSHCFTVGRHSMLNDWVIPKSPQDERWPKAVEMAVMVLDDVRQPILVSAGPWAKALIHRYWMVTPPERRQVIIDAGSALRLSNRRTRTYMIRTHPQHRMVPVWE